MCYVSVWFQWLPWFNCHCFLILYLKINEGFGGGIEKYLIIYIFKSCFQKHRLYLLISYLNEYENLISTKLQTYWNLCSIQFLFLFFYFQGNVYVKCPSIAAAIAAVNALHGRWFAGELLLHRLYVGHQVIKSSCLTQLCFFCQQVKW